MRQTLLLAIMHKEAGAFLIHRRVALLTVTHVFFLNILPLNTLINYKCNFLQFSHEYLPKYYFQLNEMNEWNLLKRATRMKIYHSENGDVLTIAFEMRMSVCEMSILMSA